MSAPPALPPLSPSPTASFAAPLAVRPPRCRPASTAPSTRAHRLFVCARSAAAHPVAWRMKRPRSPSHMPAAGPPRRAPAPGSPSRDPDSPPRDPDAAPATAPPTIPLTALERALFDLLLDVANQPGVPEVTLRVAGGWVRDKIITPNKDLGTSADIDIALDTMLGNEFAERVNQYLADKQMHRGSIGLIQKNPDQSKHLETATMRVMGFWIDLVNLRTETYAHDSRIPNIEIGTPGEDAMRRDLTINALFYNINKHCIEDFTGTGWDDIKARVIRTPLPPKTTLLDDPLRALRAIRFAARLDFSFDPPLYQACADPAVHEALAAKVSRERVSSEVSNMLADPNAPHAVALLVKLGLFPLVFTLPPPDAMQNLTTPMAELPNCALSALLNLHALEPLPECPTPIQLVRFSALLSPMAAATCMHAEPGKRTKQLPVAQYILRVQLRLSTNDSAVVCGLLSSALELRKLATCSQVAGETDTGSASPPRPDRLAAARALRGAKEHWRSAVRIALVMDMPGVTPSCAFECVAPRKAKAGGQQLRQPLSPEAATLAMRYDVFSHTIEDMGLGDAWKVRPVVNGNDLFKLLPGLKKGPKVGEIMKNQVDWMIQNPTKDVEDVRAWISAEYATAATAKKR